MNKRIPKSDIKILLKFVKLSPKTLENFYKILENLIEIKGKENFHAEFCKNEKCSEEDFKNFLNLCVKLYINLDFYEKEISDFIQEVIIFPLKKNEEYEKLNEREIENINTLMSKINSFEKSLGILSKALFLYVNTKS